ncbi:hypothetical protein ACFE04_004992 [Oxalis oulophora]
MDTTDTTRPHHRILSTATTTNNNNNTTTSKELFICFTSSRLSSSSSMKMPSKSILSPGRARDSSSTSSLSSSLSRRLRTNGSLRCSTGQASPMFPSNVKKRVGGGFENPEPSSPKVTCIALRDFNCFLPSCGGGGGGGERGKDDNKMNGSNGGGGRSCGAVFRWLVAVPDSQGKNSRDIELLVTGGGGGGGEEVVQEEDDFRRSTRHVFEGLDIDDFIKEGRFEEHNVEEGGGGRVSICIPPKNALLLMRCRSDPVKMAALANKFWECHQPQDGGFQEEEIDSSSDSKEGEKMGIEGFSNSPQEDDKVEEVFIIDHKEEIEEPKQVCQELDNCENSVQEQGNGEDCAAFEEEDLGREDNEKVVSEEEDGRENEKETDEPGHNQQVEEEIEVNYDASNRESVVEPENSGFREDELDHVMVTQEIECSCLEEEEKAEEVLVMELVTGDDNKIECDVSDMVFIEAEGESEFHGEESELIVEELKIEHEQVLDETEVEALESSEEESQLGETYEEAQSEPDQKMQEPETSSSSEAIEESLKPNVEKEKSSGLPDCLLLMMCEPKLSMEVSKETWVCGTDFIRWLPERPQKSKPVNKTENRVNSQNRDSKKRPSIDSKPNNFQLQQPPRSSCSFPAAPPPKAVPRGGSATTMASMVEQKLAGSRAYEPFVLTRCKSEPMRTASKLAPDACFWKNRKLEPHRPAATLGVGAAAGLGF